MTGAVCSACHIGKMHRYREKVILRIVGQPMFHAEQHHHEQARCRNCGRVVRADGAACVHEGVGSEYIRYDWSACAMLLFMHYTGGDPFKRVESSTGQQRALALGVVSTRSSDTNTARTARR